MKMCIISGSFRFEGDVSWYTVNLDLPPNKRWTDVITDKKKDVSLYPVKCSFYECTCSNKRIASCLATTDYSLHC